MYKVYTLVACYVTCQLCLTRSLTAQDVPRATSSKRPLVRRVAPPLSLSCAVNLTVLDSEWDLKLYPASAVALLAGYTIGCAPAL